MRAIIRLAVTALMVATLAACGGDSDGAGAGSNSAEVSRTFTFEVTSATATKVTSVKAGMDISDEGLKEEQNAALPWRHEVTVTGRPETMIPQVFVENLGSGDTITCRIMMGGNEIGKNSGEGYVDCRVTEVK